MGSEVVTDEQAFTEDHIPKKILHRDKQIKHIKSCVKPVTENKIPESLFLFGFPGTGKTASARWLLDNHHKDTGVYVNCWNCRTGYEVLREILLGLDVLVHGRESTGELVDKLGKKIKEKKIVVALDEIDKLKDHDVLYTLSRNGCGLILISNKYDALAQLNNRIESSLALTEIEFPLYSSEQMFDILKFRAEKAMRPRSFEDELIGVASVAANGDARVGLQTIKKAGRIAENKGTKKVTMDDIRKAVETRKKLSKSFPLSHLNDDQRVIYKILGEKGKMLSGELYRAYCQRVSQHVKDRAYRKWMRKMVRLGLAKEKGYGRWKEYEVVV